MLPKNTRLNTQLAQEVKLSGVKYFSPHLKLIIAPGKHGNGAKWQIKVFKKTYPLSTDRNRAKRKIREAIKQINSKIKTSLNIIVQLTKPINQVTTIELQKEITESIHRTGTAKE